MRQTRPGFCLSVSNEDAILRSLPQPRHAHLRSVTVHCRLISPARPKRADNVSHFIATLKALDYGQLFRAVLDVSVVAYVLYRLILLAKGRRAWQILIGLG